MTTALTSNRPTPSFVNRIIAVSLSLLTSLFCSELLILPHYNWNRVIQWLSLGYKMYRLATSAERMDFNLIYRIMDILITIIVKFKCTSSKVLEELLTL